MLFLKHRSDIIIIACLAASVITCGCAKTDNAEVGEKAASGETAKKKDNTNVIASVGDKIITPEEYKKEFTMLPETHKNIAALYKDKFLESLVSKHLLLKEAKKRNLQDRDSVKEMANRAHEEIMIQELINESINEKSDITETDIERHYSDNQTEYMEPPKTGASHILVDSEAAAIKIADDLKMGADFVELAREYSLDTTTKDNGGDLGYFSKGQLIPEFEEACDDLEIGQVSGAVKSSLGYHIIKLTGREEAKVTELDKVRDTIKQQLTVDRQIELYDELLEGLKAKEKIVINEDLLKEIDLSNPTDIN